MIELEQFFCPNEQCKDYSQRRQGNIAVRGKYGKDNNRDLRYCRSCGKRFAATRSSARLLEMDKDTVNRVILRAGEHCAHVLSGLLRSLELTEAQLDELWTFVKKRKVLAAPKILNSSTDGRGSGQPSTPPRAC